MSKVFQFLSLLLVLLLVIEVPVVIAQETGPTATVIPPKRVKGRFAKKPRPDVDGNIHAVLAAEERIALSAYVTWLVLDTRRCLSCCQRKCCTIAWGVRVCFSQWFRRPKSEETRDQKHRFSRALLARLA